MLAQFKLLLAAAFIVSIGVSCRLQPAPPPPRPLATPPATTAVATTVVPQKTINDGVFTPAQVLSGQRVYDASCKTCHDLRFYRETLRAWQGQSLLDFWYSILGQMPADNPGSLLDSEYTEVIAYILSELGFPAGTTALDPVNGMAQINIVAQ